MKKIEVRIFSSHNLDDKWYVYLYLDGKIIKKIYKGLNSGKTFEERMFKAEVLKATLEKEISLGWNPKVKKNIVRMSLTEALDFGLEKKKSTLSPGSHNEYGISITLLKDYCIKAGYEKLSINECDRYHVKTILDMAKNDRNWSGRNYNKVLRNLNSIFNELIEWEIISSSPARDIKAIKESNIGQYELMSDKEHQDVFSKLKKLHQNYYVFCSVVYYMGIRPGELIKIKCSDVLMKKEVIIVGSKNSKNNKTRVVPIIGTIKEHLANFDLSNSEYYLFGAHTTNRTPGLVPNYFSPNPFQVKRKYPTDLWRRLVIQDMKVNKKLYSLKHKGGSDKLKAGLDLKAVSSIFGHSSEKITEIYANFINDIRFDEAKKIKLDHY
ncbi:site-specific integrase [Chryseobacterium sp. WG14]|uniref:tyrosine-type recombinase/integrase n=1 Tax=Chryseobacterium sp. WG14 TaxID=2926909 RepID=UPI00211ECE4B|nr:site-specific integrase [Chryseobacterium sp. WG14]MCQ9638582.1 site-specific integrase [Chryseobacterium sp. WG14]